MVRKTVAIKDDLFHNLELTHLIININNLDLNLSQK